MPRKQPQPPQSEGLWAVYGPDGKLRLTTLSHLPGMAKGLMTDDTLSWEKLEDGGWTCRRVTVTPEV